MSSIPFNDNHQNKNWLWKMDNAKRLTKGCFLFVRDERFL